MKQIYLAYASSRSDGVSDCIFGTESEAKELSKELSKEVVSYGAYPLTDETLVEALKNNFANSQDIYDLLMTNSLVEFFPLTMEYLIEDLGIEVE